MFPLSQFLHRKIIYLFVHQASTQECNTSPVSMQAFSSSHSSFPTNAIDTSLLQIAYPPLFSSRSKMSDQPAFSLLVTLTFSAPEYIETFLEDVRPLCEYVKEHEPTTIAYEVLKSDSDPLVATLLERYVDKEQAYLNIHKSSAAFLEFRPKLKAMQETRLVSVEGQSYLDSGLGFGDRA